MKPLSMLDTQPRFAEQPPEPVERLSLLNLGALIALFIGTFLAVSSLVVIVWFIGGDQIVSSSEGSHKSALETLFWVLLPIPLIAALLAIYFSLRSYALKERIRGLAISSSIGIALIILILVKFVARG